MEAFSLDDLSDAVACPRCNKDRLAVVAHGDLCGLCFFGFLPKEEAPKGERLTESPDPEMGDEGLVDRLVCSARYHGVLRDVGGLDRTSVGDGGEEEDGDRKAVLTRLSALRTRIKEAEAVRDALQKERDDLQKEHDGYRQQLQASMKLEEIGDSMWRAAAGLLMYTNKSIAEAVESDCPVRSHPVERWKWIGRLREAGKLWANATGAKMP